MKQFVQLTTNRFNKNIYCLLLTLMISFFGIGSASAIAPGTYAIGPQVTYAGYLGTYPTFSAAVTAASGLLTGNVIFEFQNDYAPVVETLPIAMTPAIVTSVTATLTFRPALNVAAPINFSGTGTVLNNAGASYITIDGRPGGIGVNKFLQFTSSSTTVATVLLSGNSVFNQFLYCGVKGSNTTQQGGIMVISAPQNFSGNNNYTVNNCNFDGSGVARNLLFTIWTASDATITFNNFFDYRNGSGVWLISGSNNAVIDNNNFYQTTVYNGFNGTTCGIYVNGGSNNRISNNNIGGSGPGLTGTWTVSAIAPDYYNFIGIYAIFTIGPNKIYNNKIQNFDWKANTSTWRGIDVSGPANVGTDGANLIGSNTGVDNIKVTFSPDAATGMVRGISTTGPPIVENNNIGSITTLLAAGVTGASGSIIGIYVSGSGLINNNTIGSLTTPLSINASNQSTSVGGSQNVYGIQSFGSNVVLTNNKIANLNNGSTDATGATKGIYLPNYAATVSLTANSIFSISTSQPNTGANFAGASLNGIDIQASQATSIVVTGNTIYDLINTTPTAAVTVNGIYYNAAIGANNKIDKNYIHSFKTTSNTAVQNGLNINYGTCTFQNNVIRLGIDITGASVTSTAQINGILKSTYSDCKYYFNTVYVGGSGVTAGTVKSYAFALINRGTVAEEVLNNIFVNMRTNAVANKLNYATSLPAIGANPYTCDYNIYNVSTTDGILASVAGVDIINMANLQASYPGSDQHSGFGDPLLTLPAANLATMNLKPLNLTPAEGNGIAIASVTDDFTSLLRSGLTPTDIGAYSGNFTLMGASQDIFAPVISYTKLGNASTVTPRITVAFATITDKIGVNVTAGTKPRIYFKLSTNANAFPGNTSADNGWKWVESSSVASPFNFSINYSLLFGAPVVAGNVIQYFVVAQDLATTPNVSFMPSLGASGTSVAPAGMTAPTTPNSYTITTALASLIYVGATYPITTLTGTGGLFDVINNGVIRTNTTVYVMSNTVEPGTVSLNLINEEGPNAGTLTLSILNSSVTSCTLQGNVATTLAPMISITGAKRVTFDGGTGKFVFNNTNTNPLNAGPVLQIDNSSQNILITNSNFESNASYLLTGAITVGSIGINNVTITGCNIHDAALGPFNGSPNTGIYSNSVNNTLTIISNNIYNFKNSLWYNNAYGMYITAASGCTIQGNSIYSEATMSPQCSLTGIYFSGTGTNSITGNFIGGSAPLCNGIFTVPGANISFTGIATQTSVAGTTVQNNIIQNIAMTNPTPTVFNGINHLWGPILVSGNTIGSAGATNAIWYAGIGTYMSPSPSAGIKNSDQSGLNTYTFLNNTIANIAMIAPSATPVFNGMMMTGGLVQQNKIFNIGSSDATNSPTICGIYNSTGLASNEYSNNTISLNGGISNNPTLNGFYDASSSTGTSGFYYNSINIYGIAINSTAQNHAFIRTGTADYILKDNILVNYRTGGTGINYAITSNVATNFVSNYNDLFVAGTILGRWNGADNANLAAWKTASLQDANSISADPLFTLPTNLLPSILSPVVSAGTPIATVLIDINNLVRSTTSPTMGAYDFGCTNPKTGGTITANQSGCGSYTPNPLASTAVPTGYNGILEYKWQSSVTPFTTWTDIATSNLATYAPGLITQTTQFKRVAHAACSAVLPWPVAGESNVVTITVESAVAAAGAIIGSATYVPGSTGVAYSVGAIANATSYVWAYSGIGVNINGTGNAVTLDFAATATPGTLTVQGKNTCGVGVVSSLIITLAPKTLSLKVFLEGPFNGTTAMTTALNTTPQLIPLAQPFNNGTTWSYAGTESVTAIPAGVVDWVLVELRDATSPVAAIPTTKLLGWPRPYFLKSDGTIVGLDGVSLPSIGNPTVVNTLYVIIRHRNHIGIMSQNAMTFTGTTYNYSYDFTTASTQAYGGLAGYKQIATGVFGMVSGDVDGDGSISVLDFSKWAADFGKTGIYLPSDITLSGNVSVLGFSKWALNFGAANLTPLKSLNILGSGVKYSTQIPGNK